jgi:hypothetical protein
MRNSGCTFVRAVGEIIEPIKAFTDSYVDDIAVHSSSWQQHLNDTIKRFLQKVRDSGLTLAIKKMSIC